MSKTDRPRLERLAWLFALAVAITPLWVARDLPQVDLPQHSYVIAVLQHAHDPATLYPRYFEARPGFRPYIGHYVVVGLLARMMPIDVGNRIFITACVVAFPLAIAFLLRCLGRQAWPALLTIPFAYGDAFGWGFMNYCASLPLMFVILGLWVKALADAPRRAQWTVCLVACLLALAATHPGPVFYLALGLPFLLLTTRTPEDAMARGIAAWLRPRVASLAILGWCALALGTFAASVALRSRTVAAAVARSDWYDLITQRHLEFRPLGESLLDFPVLLANLLRDGSDRLGPLAAGSVALAAVVAARFDRGPAPGPVRPWFERARPLGLVAIALTLYLALPLHIRGYVGYVSPRMVPIVAAFAVGLVPPLGARSHRAFVWLAAAASLATAVPLVRGFRAFDRESAPLRMFHQAMGERPTVFGLVYDFDSRVVRHPAYLHAAATLARAGGGIPNYSLAAWPNSPIRHRTAPPPPLEDECCREASTTRPWAGPTTTSWGGDARPRRCSASGSVGISTSPRGRGISGWCGDGRRVTGAVLA